MAKPDGAERTGVGSGIAGHAAGARALAALVERLDIERLDETVFTADPGPGRRRLFGGLVAAQAVVAAGRTVALGQLHSLHAYFLRPGRHEPIRLEVDRVRDGRSFTTRRVTALQRGEAIFDLTASFARPEPGIAHHDEMPDSPEPEGLPAMRSLSGYSPESSPLDFREYDPCDGAEHGWVRRIWMRANGPVPEDPLIHTALLVFASDRSLLSTAARVQPIDRTRLEVASLDHALWLHEIPRLDDWILYATQSPVAASARAWVQGAMYARSGRRIATVAQEGLIRVRR